MGFYGWDRDRRCKSDLGLSVIGGRKNYSEFTRGTVVGGSEIFCIFIDNIYCRQSIKRWALLFFPWICGVTKWTCSLLVGYTSG